MNGTKDNDFYSRFAVFSNFLLRFVSNQPTWWCFHDMKASYYYYYCCCLKPKPTTIIRSLTYSPLVYFIKWCWSGLSRSHLYNIFFWTMNMNKVNFWFDSWCGKFCFVIIIAWMCLPSTFTFIITLIMNGRRRLMFICMSINSMANV